MIHVFINNEDIVGYHFTPEMFLKPAFLEYLKRAIVLPRLIAEGIWKFVRHPLSLGFIESFSDLGRAIPAGIFDNETINHALSQVFNYEHRTNDFRQLKNKLYLIAVDLDTGEAVKFGAPGYDHVPISRAVQASAALPGLFPPVKIDDRYFVDGALLKTLHASVVLDQGVDLALCVNPLVPFDASLAVKKGRPKHENLIHGGLPVVLSQTFRAIIYSRMRVGISSYDTRYPNADVIVFEPNRDDEEMFFTNVFSYASRHRLCEHAYQMTRRELRARSKELTPILSRHGVTLRMDILEDKTRHFCSKCPAELVAEDEFFETEEPKIGIATTAVTVAEKEGRVALELTSSLDQLQQWINTRSRSESTLSK
jgi:predicted acylesterase/phospholipase RssA